jgi:anti-sigma factor RsiW
MSQLTLAIHNAPHSEWLLRWQATVIGALAGGSLIAALCNIGALMTLSIARSAVLRPTAAHRWAEPHG